ncbi:hypothetical protein D3C84_1310630 [compost metagenome]
MNGGAQVQARCWGDDCIDRNRGCEALDESRSCDAGGAVGKAQVALLGDRYGV